MLLEIIEINLKLGYVAVLDKKTDKTYFTQGEEGINDISFIQKFGESAFLDMLSGSGYFD